jgi:hypothetical protein
MLPRHRFARLIQISGKWIFCKAWTTCGGALEQFLDSAGLLHTYLVGAFHWGDLTHDEATRSLQLYATEVKPALAERRGNGLATGLRGCAALTSAVGATITPALIAHSPGPSPQTAQRSVHSGRRPDPSWATSSATSPLRSAAQ